MNSDISHQRLKVAAVRLAMCSPTVARTAMRWSAFASVALLPILWAQYASGYNIPPREPPAAASGVSDESLGSAGESFDAEQAVRTAPVVEGQSALEATTQAAIDSSARISAQAMTRGGAPEQQASPDARGGDSEAVATSLANPETGVDLQQADAERSRSSVTIVVQDPGVVPSAPSAGSMTTVAQSSAPEIVEVEAPAHELGQLAVAVPPPGGQEPQQRHTRRRAKLTLAFVSDAVTSKTRGLLNEGLRADAADATLAKPVSAPSASGFVNQLQGSRGIAQVADLGRTSRMSGAAPDVFADRHHVVAVACDASTYIDNPYFNRDPFGNSRSPKCP